MTDTRTYEARQQAGMHEGVDELVAISIGYAAAAAKGHVPAANTAAVVTLTAPGAEAQHALAKILASYSAAPTGGKLTITSGATTLLDLDVPAAGLHQIDFEPPLLGPANGALVVTLSAGGGTVAGKLYVHSGVSS